MAIFGFHFVLTLVAATVFSKITSRISICEWAVIRGLYYYLLQGSLMPPPQKSSSGKEFKRRKKPSPAQEGEDRLLRLPLTAKALDGVPFFSSFFWTYNYFVFALAVYFISDVFTLIFPQNHDRNTSVIWIICALFFFLHVLCKLTAVKLSSNELRAERNVIVSFAGIFFLAAMIFVMFSDNFMDVEFQRGYRTLVESLNDFLAAHGYDSFIRVGTTSTAADAKFANSNASPLLFLIGLTVVFTIISATFLFPNFQYAASYVEMTESSERSPLLKFSLHAAFFLPLLIFLFFTKPVKVHFMTTSGISNSALDALRIVLVILWAALRCGTAKPHLQTFLDQPTSKIVELRQDSQLKADERQTRVAYYASYFCAAALQYFLPVFITLTAALLLKNLGGIEFTSLWRWSTETPPVSPTPPTFAATADADGAAGAQALEILLSAHTQKPLWTLCLVAFLGIQSALSIIGVVFKRIDMSRV